MERNEEGLEVIKSKAFKTFYTRHPSLLTVTPEPARHTVVSSTITDEKNSLMLRRKMTDTKLSYKVKLQFQDHHIVGKDDLHCEPNKVPDKSPSHMQKFEFDKSPKRFEIHDNRVDSHIMKMEQHLTKSDSIRLLYFLTFFLNLSI